MQYKTIHVEASRSYDINIGKGLLTDVARLIRPLVGECRLAVITDSNVDALHGERLMQVLADGGYNAVKYVIPAGEIDEVDMEAYLAFLKRRRK